MAGRDLSSELFADAPASGGKDLSSELFDKKPAAMGWSDAPLNALKSIPSSAGNVISGFAQAVRHPINTFTTLKDAAIGGVENFALNAINSENESRAQRGKAPVQSIASSYVGHGNTPEMDTADAFGGLIKDRYGSMDALKNTISNDPVGLAFDLSALASGGATMASKIPALSKALSTVSKVTNPVNAVTKTVGYVAPKIGNLSANLIGEMGTRTGGETIKQAFRSGIEGGDSAKSFADNMRGNVPMTDVLNDAKANLQAMGQAKSKAYRDGMAQVSGDKSILDFSNIDKAIADAGDVVTFKGKVKNTRAAQVQQEIADAVREWKGHDPAEYHTPEGLDALKQKIGGIVESIPFEEKTAGMVGNKIYNSIKSEIVKQAPVYADTMKDYAEATDQIREVERALSLGKKASVDTAMRKLQSLTRNNANTNYGNRLDLAKTMEQQGGREIMPALAGQALSSMTPRGMGNAVAGGLGLGSYAVGGAPLAIPTLAVQSPRLMGESALAAGKVYGAGQRAANVGGGLLDMANIDPAEMANYLYQAGRLPQQ